MSIKDNKTRVQVTMLKEIKTKVDAVAKATHSTFSETIMTLIVAGLIAMSINTDEKKGEQA